MYGEPGFKAFRLPANGRVELDEYTVDASQEISEIEVLEVVDLRVNGRMPLEQWLPYRVTSGNDVKIKSDAYGNSINLDWDTEKSDERNDYPNEKVADVRADGIKHWRVVFQNKP